MIKDQINNDKPMLIRWGWDGGGGHMLVIRGYEETFSGLLVSYIDPLKNSYQMKSYSWMQRYDNHTWTHTRYGMRRSL